MRDRLGAGEGGVWERESQASKKGSRRGVLWAVGGGVVCAASGERFEAGGVGDMDG